MSPPPWMILAAIAVCLIAYGYFTSAGSKPDPGKTPDQEDDE